MNTTFAFLWFHVGKLLDIFVKKGNYFALQHILLRILLSLFEAKNNVVLIG